MYPHGPLLAVLALVSGTAFPGFVSADPGKVTVELRDVPLRQAVQLVLAGSAFQGKVEDRVPDVPVTLSLRDITAPTALRLVVRQAGLQVPELTLSRTKSVYSVHIRRPAR